MELRDALTQIDEIRLQLARARLFRGFRALPTAASGLFAGATAYLQSQWIEMPLREPRAFVGLWIACAALSSILAGAAMWHDCARDPSPLTARRTREVLARLAPPFAAGALVTAALSFAAPSAVWTLPALWPVFFSLALFACRSLLPLGIGYVAAAYMVAGGAVLTLGADALSPWTMGLVFGLGQLWAGLVLHVHVEREGRHVATD